MPEVCLLAFFVLCLPALWGWRRLAALKGALKMAEARARIQRQWLEATLAGISDAVITADHEGRVGFINPAAEAFLGIDAGEVLGHSVDEFVRIVDSATRRPLESLLQRAYASGGPVVADSDPALCLRDGRLRPVDASATPIRDAAGQALGGVMVLRDASRQRARESAMRQAYAELDRRAGERRAALEKTAAALRESTALLQSFAASTSELIFAKDRDGRVMMANPAALRVLGLGREQVLGRADLILFGGPEELVGERESDARIIATGEAMSCEQTCMTAEGARTYVVTRSPLRDEQGQIIGVVGVATDITERHRAQRELEHLLVAEHRLRGEAERASRAKDEFLAIVSHELRSPLNALKGWSHILTGSFNPEGGLVMRAALAIRRNVEHQTRLIDDLLDTSRIISGKLEIERRPVNMVEVVHAAIDLSRASALAKRIDLSLASERPALVVDGDYGRLQQVVINLLSNAIKFTPEGGRVEIGLRTCGERVQLTVADTGIGIDADFLPHVFDRFSQADSSTIRRYGGLGIGLALVRYLVELHGGGIRAASAGRGKGSAFTVELPALRCTAGLSWPGAAAEGFFPPGRALAGIRILLADDDPDARDVMQISLAQAGAEVHVCESGGELLALLAAGGLPAGVPSVLLLDIAMPGDDGFAVLARVRALAGLPFIPAVAVTAMTSLDRRRLAAAGFQSCVGKPVEVDRLIEIIVNLVAADGQARSA